jgi:hypothetical protein
MRSLVSAVLKVVVLLAGLAALGQVLARRRTFGDETSDEFGIAAYVGGAQRTCRAASLRRGSVSVVLGGVDLDLREATLDPAGADLDLSASWGGVNVTVPRGWRVQVEDRATLGGVEAHVTPPEELPDEAPLLRVVASARFGGVSIAAKDPAADAPHELRGLAST